MSTAIGQLPVGVNGKVSRDIFMGTVSLRGITPEDIPLLWKWLQEYPHQNFDDYGPKVIEEFEVELIRRMQRNTVYVIALQNHKPVGCIGYEKETPRTGSFRGICFAKSVHRTGVAAFAVKHFLRSIFNAGTEKVSACYFSDNLPIKNFLKKQGFGLEGTLMAHTMRRGVPTKMSLVALHKKNFMEKV